MLIRYNFLAYYQDINMMALLNGKERSLNEFKAIGYVLLCASQLAILTAFLQCRCWAGVREGVGLRGQRDGGIQGPRVRRGEISVLQIVQWYHRCGMYI